jgi:phosphate transport system ATP-binding protein
MNRPEPPRDTDPTTEIPTGVMMPATAALTDPEPAITDGPTARTTATGVRLATPARSGSTRLTDEELAAREPAVVLKEVSVYYGAFRAVKDISFDVPGNAITSLIGPSGSGKSTLLRSINRMNELIPGTRVEGEVRYQGENLYAEQVDPVEVRRRIGMVFQKPNPFPKSIYDNVAFGPRLNGVKGNLDELVEKSLRRAALWDDVKDKLKQSGLALSGGQQQRLCIARTVAVDPEIILMDEPASALDPRSTLQIEELMFELKRNYTIIVVTHNMQQAARASDFTVFMNMAEDRAGYIVERGPTIDIFTNPKDRLTEDYVSGRFG